MSTLHGYAAPENLLIEHESILGSVCPRAHEPGQSKHIFSLNYNLECLELNEKLRAPSGEAGELVQPEPELRAGIPEAADILGQVP